MRIFRDTGSNVTEQRTNHDTGRSIARFSHPVSRFLPALFVLALCLVATDISAAPGSALKTASGASPSSAILCVDDVNAYAPGAPCTNALTYTTINAAVLAASPGDEIRVATGTFTGDTVGTSVSIVGGYIGGAGGFATSDPASNNTTVQGITFNTVTSIGNIYLVNAFGGTGNVTFTGTTTWVSGTMSGTGTTTVPSGATLNISGFVTLSGRMLNNAGTTNFTSGQIDLSNGAVFDNSGTFDMYISLPLASSNSTGTFNNSGTFRKHAGTSYLQILKPSANTTFNNTGNIDIPDGILHFLQGTFNLQPGTTITGAGTPQVGAQSGIWNLSTAVNVQTLNLVGPSCPACNGITGTGTLNISSDFEWSGGTLQGGSTTNILPGATANIGYANLAGATFNNNGTANFVSGNFLFYSAGVFNNNGTLNSAANHSLLSGDGATGTIYNTGTFINSNGSCQLNSGVAFSNGGTVDVQGGDLGFPGGAYTQTTGITNVTGGLWSHTVPMVFQGGTLMGLGTVDVTSTSLHNTGATISPGDAPNSAGTLSITGDLTQSAGGKLNIEIGGTSPGTGYDRLTVSGVATLAGTLNTSAINGFVPLVGQQYTVLTYNSHTGTFGQITGGQFSTAYNPGDLTLTVTGAVGTATPAATPTRTPTRTFTPTNTPTRTNTATRTNTPTRTNTAASTNTATRTLSPTVTRTFTSSPTPSNTSTGIPSASATSTPTRTPTPSNTSTTVPSASATGTTIPSATPTSSNTPTPTGTSTSTSTSTNTAVPATPTSCQADTWGYSTSLPDATGGAAVATLGNYLYEAGGTNGSGIILNTARRFDGTVWSPIANLPTAVSGASGVSDGSRFFVIGGLVSVFSSTTQVQVFDPATGTWSQAASLHAAVSGASATYYNGRIYLFGDCGGYSCVVPGKGVAIYDIASNTWTAGANLPTAVAGAAVKSIGSYIYVAGGTGAGENAIANAYRYNPSTNTWDDAAMADMPVTRGLGVSALYNGKMYIYGGLSWPGILNSTVIYNPVSNSWSSGPSLSAAIWAASGDSYQGSLFLVGGDQSYWPNYGQTGAVEKLTFGTCPTATTGPSATPLGTATNTPSPTATQCAVTSWQLSTNLPAGKADAALVSLGGYLYEAGGEDAVYGGGGLRAGEQEMAPLLLPGSPDNRLSTAARFDGTTWTPIASMPAALSQSASAIDGSRFYVMGGYAVTVIDSIVLAYNPGTDSWSQAARMPLAVAGATATYYNGKIYVFGGCTVWDCTRVSNTTQIYDVAANSWSMIANMPLGVSNASSRAIGSYIYLAGGFTGISGGLATSTNKVYRFDPATSSWNDGAAADLPATWWGAASAVYSNKLYLYGGVYNGYASWRSTIFDPTSNTWSYGPNLNESIYRQQGDLYQGVPYNVGGYTYVGQYMPTAYVEKMQFPSCPTPLPTGTSIPTNTLTPTRTNTPGGPTGTPSSTSTQVDYDILHGTATIVPGTTDVGNHCDGCYSYIYFPFGVRLYNQRYDMGLITTDGQVILEWGADNPVNTCLPAFFFDGTIFPFWDDLVTDCTGCGIFTSVSGSTPSRIFNIEWRTHLKGGTLPVNFEVRLYENSSRFDLVYGQIDGNGSGATIGVMKDNFTFTQYLCNPGFGEGQKAQDSLIQPGDALSFTLPENSQPSPTATVCTLQFSDVPAGSTFYTYVRCLACRGILNGYQDGTFRPQNNMTRGQLAKVTANAAGFAENHTDQSFQDVPVQSTFHLYIQRLAVRGFVGGYACGGPGEPCVAPYNLPYFRPDSNVTRGQVSKIIASAALLPDPPAPGPAPAQQLFEDVPADSTFHLWVDRMAGLGIVSGYPCGGTGEPCGPDNLPYFRPSNNVTRGQAAKFVSNTFFPECAP